LGKKDADCIDEIDVDASAARHEQQGLVGAGRGAASFEPVFVAGRCSFPAPVQWFSVQNLVKRTLSVQDLVASDL
jgi:hypothetical protein